MLEVLNSRDFVVEFVGHTGRVPVFVVLFLHRRSYFVGYNRA